MYILYGSRSETLWIIAANMGTDGEEKGNIGKVLNTQYKIIWKFKNRNKKNKIYHDGKQQYILISFN